MKTFLILAGLSLATPALAKTPGCFMNKVQNSSGATLTLSNGNIYMVTPGRDRIAVQLWAPLDKLQICRGAGSASIITNLSKPTPSSIQAFKQ